MNRLSIVVAAAAAFAFAAPASSQEALAKSEGCMNCHDVSTKKVGPSFKDIAAKYKGQADAEAKLVTAISEGKGHPKTKASGDNAKSLVKWVLSQ